MKEVTSAPSKVSSPGKALATIADTLVSRISREPSPDDKIETGIERPKAIGLSIAFLVFGVFGIWSATAPIEGAAHAPGIIKVKSNNGLVQHYEGGIVKSINVQNGDFVNAGDILLVMDPTQSLAQLEISNVQLMSLSALEARLLAERDGLDAVVYPPMMHNANYGGKEEIDAQNHVFSTRKTAQDGSIAVLEQRVEQLSSRVTGLKAVLESKQVLAASYAEELEDFRSLLEEGFTDKQRLRQLERSHAQASGEAAELSATIASTEIQIGETKLQILQQRNEFQNEVANQLAEVQARLKDTRERITALSDIVSRKDIKAPIAGVVSNLQVHTERAVLSPGSPIAEIVPQGEALIIEATVMTTDIDRVAEGQDAVVRLSAFSSRTIPTLHGTVLSLSADALQDRASGAHYYLARIELTPESVQEIEGFELVPGMPAEVFISTGSRTLLQYLMKPLSNAVARGLRED